MCTLTKIKHILSKYMNLLLRNESGDFGLNGSFRLRKLTAFLVNWFESLHAWVQDLFSHRFTPRMYSWNPWLLCVLVLAHVTYESQWEHDLFDLYYFSSLDPFSLRHLFKHWMTEKHSQRFLCVCNFLYSQLSP